jgi:hypothetical protein
LISELTFSREYGSFWRGLTPTSEAFIRQVNLGLSERWCRPLAGETVSARRAFVNELGFCLFRDLAGGVWRGRGWVRPSDRDAVVQAAVGEAWRRVRPLAERAGKDRMGVEEGELREAISLAGRLQAYFREVRDLVVEPTFAGCGVVDQCRGDLLADSTLTEIKAGERRGRASRISSFRSVDIRQILTYLALNHAAPEPKAILEVCLLNPRLGLAFKTTVQDLCFNVSGLETRQLLDSVSFEMSRSDVSR